MKKRHSDRTAASDEEFLQGDQPLEDAEGMEEVFATLASMKTEVELMRRPLGTFESPARTCKELMMVQPSYNDGKTVLLDVHSFTRFAANELIILLS